MDTQYGSVQLSDTKSKRISWAEWKRPLVAVVLTFLCNVESSMIAMGEWPYMTTMDPETTASFYGYTTAASKATHAFFGFVFAFWAYKISGIRIPMLVARCLTLLACVMYICVEFIPENRRWWMLACYILFGVGFGTSPLLRSYIAQVTTEENRASAYALHNGATMLSVVVGPLAQISFAGVPYPGLMIIPPRDTVYAHLPPHIKLNIYTAPVWFAVITNIIAILIVLFLLKDVEKVTVETTSQFSFASFKEKLLRIRSLNVPWVLVALVLFEKMVNGVFNSTTLTMIGPIMTSMYAFDGTTAVVILASSQMVVGVLALILSLIFMLCKLGNRVSCRFLLLFTNLLVLAGYAITYSYPFDSSPLKPYNETAMTGCNPAEYSWCDTQLVVNIIPYIITFIIVMSFANPFGMTSVDTIYSKIIGPIDQNVMQSIFVLADDIMQTVGPIYASAVFTAIGVNYLNIINGGIYLLGIVVWLAAWKWLAPYK